MDYDEIWENERTPTPLRVFGVRLHSVGLSVRDVAAVLELLGIDRSNGVIWNWTHKLSEAQSDPPTAAPLGAAVDEKRIEVDGEKKWLYAAIDTESKLLLEIDVFSSLQNTKRSGMRTRRCASCQRHGTDSVAAFLHRLTEKHNLHEIEFLIDAAAI